MGISIYSDKEESNTDKIWYANSNRTLRDSYIGNPGSFDVTPTYPDNPLYVGMEDIDSFAFKIYILMPNDNATLSDYENRIGVMVNENNLPSNKISLPLDSSYAVDQNLYIYDDNHQTSYENVKFIYADISHMAKITSTNENHYIVAYIRFSPDTYYEYYYHDYVKGGKPYINDSSHQGTISARALTGDDLVPFVDLSSTAGVLLTGQSKKMP